MIAKTHGIVLRTFPYSETSRIVTWLTRDAGRLTTINKGAHRPKSHLLGQFDSFYTCEILYYEKQSNHLHILRECSPLRTRDRFRHDWRACAVASYLCGLLYRIVPAGAVQPGLYQFADTLLDTLHHLGAQPALLFWAELQLLQQLGLAPQLHACSGCSAPGPSLRDPVTFAIDHGHFLCGQCQAGPVGSHGLTIGPHILAPLAGWQKARSPRMASATRCTATQQQAIDILLGRFMEYHLDLPMEGRAMTLRLLDPARLAAAS